MVIAIAFPNKCQRNLFGEGNTMSYKNAEQILPIEVIEMIQQYIDGENIYIPRKAERRKEWGESTQTRRELSERNRSIYRDYQSGMSTSELAEEYFLSQKSIQRIVLQMKKMI